MMLDYEKNCVDYDVDHTTVITMQEAKQDSDKTPLVATPVPQDGYGTQPVYAQPVAPQQGYPGQPVQPECGPEYTSKHMSMHIYACACTTSSVDTAMPYTGVSIDQSINYSRRFA